MSGEWMGDPYAAQLRAAKAEGELAGIKDATSVRSTSTYGTSSARR